MTRATLAPAVPFLAEVHLPIFVVLELVLFLEFVFLEAARTECNRDLPEPNRFVNLFAVEARCG